MKVKNVSYVNITELFKGYPDLAQAFMEGDPPCSWGDNELSLIKPKLIATMMTELWPDTEGVNTVLKRLKTLGKTLVNLEG